MNKALVLGAGGFIGNHIVKKLKNEGFWVRGVDKKNPQFETTCCDEFLLGDLRDNEFVKFAFENKTFEEVYQLAADMGGAGYIFSGENDYDIVANSLKININVCDQIIKNKVINVFFSSSACVYPKFNQLDSLNPKCDEASAYPAFPDSEYGWEKLFSERLYFSLMRNKKINVHIARYHNIYGPGGVFNDGKEKAPAAICRKVIEQKDGFIEIWGDGTQTRSFLYIDDCLEATLRFMRSDFSGPVNIGSEEMISINELAKLIISFSGKDVKIKNIKGPTGVQGRNSDNKLIFEKINWNPKVLLEDGIFNTYKWIEGFYL
jgi:GDP-D-mannose 3', 5'-epimerase